MSACFDPWTSRSVNHNLTKFDQNSHHNQVTQPFSPELILSQPFLNIFIAFELITKKDGKCDATN